MRVQEMFYLVSNALDTWVDPAFTERKASGGEVISCSCSVNADAIL